MSPALAQHLHDSGYAETHLHLGAAFEFPLLWVATLVRISDSSLKYDAFYSPGAELAEGRLLGPWLIRAAITRYVLAAYLATGSQDSNFAEFLDSDVEQRLGKLHDLTGYISLLEVLSELRRGWLDESDDPSFDFAELQGLYRKLIGASVLRYARNHLQEVDQADPIFPLFPRTSYNQTTAELRFTSAALAYLKDRYDKDRSDPMFSQLFWQVVRTRAIFYRHVTQRPMTPGLQWFIRFYDRLRAPKHSLPTRTLVRSAAWRGGIHRGLRSLEVRTSPDPNESTLLQFVSEVDEAARDLRQEQAPKQQNPRETPRDLEVGIVFHFTKDRGGGALQGRPKAYGLASHANPEHEEFPGYRYSRFFCQKHAEARSLVWLLRHFPLTLELVRGLDVCTDEVGIPNWVLAPLFTYVRDAGRAASNTLRRELGLEVPPLRTSAHAGEDFVHLLTGLRNLDETIEHYKLAQGDRIGHGLALGIDPRQWASRAGCVAITREERLWDLVWVWEQQGKTGGGRQDNTRGSLEYELAELSYEIFREDCIRRLLPHDLAMLRHDLYDQTRLSHVGYFNDTPLPIVKDELRSRLLYEYLTDPVIFKRSQELCWIDPSSESEWLASLQANLRRKVGALGIVVEVNPTSNLLVGDLGDLMTHPLWRLRPPRPLADDVPPVSICIGSDDPITFASDLRQEYQRLADTMILTGFSEEEARQWLERTRVCSMQSRFTVPRSRYLLLDFWTSDDSIWGF